MVRFLVTCSSHGVWRNEGRGCVVGSAGRVGDNSLENGPEKGSGLENCHLVEQDHEKRGVAAGSRAHDKR